MRKPIAAALAAALLLGPPGALLGVACALDPAAQYENCAAGPPGPVSQAPASLTADTAEGTAVTLGQAQLAHAATIIDVGRQTPGVGVPGIAVALTAALTESGLRMLANTGAYLQSAGYPNDGDGSDHDSLGMFQMRPSTGWGTVAQLMDPSYQARAFYGGPAGPNHGTPRGLLDIPGWQQLGAGQAAQAVEVSAYPDRYANYQPVADAILAALAGSPGSTAGEPAVCGTGTAGDAQQIARALVADHARGALTDLEPAMYTQEIEATANGTVAPDCQVDPRILQLIALTVQHFGSAGISDLGRPCVGSTLDCPASAHCTIPDQAVDFTSIAGQALDGSDPPDIALLEYLDGILPAGSWAGQSECRADAGDSLRLAHIRQFPDTCTHQHIDIHGAGSAPLTP